MKFKWYIVCESTLETIKPYANLKYSFPNGSVVKNLPEIQETCRRCGFHPWVRKILCRKKWQLAPVLLPGKSNGQRSLADYSPRGHKLLVTTERPNDNKLATLLLFSRSSHVWLFEAPWTAARQASLSFTIFQSLLKCRSIELVMPSNHLVLCCLLLLPQSFPASGSFLVSQVARVLELQLQHQSFQWIFRTHFLYNWLVWSPCSPRDSQESSPTPQFKSINSSVLSFLYSPTLTSIHDHWKNHSFD